MPLYHGSTKIKDLYIGSTKIAKLYHGSTEVYSATAPAPYYNFIASSSSSNKLIGSINGQTWETIDSSDSGYYYRIYKVSELQTQTTMYIAHRSSGAIKVSTDGGATWTSKASIPSSSISEIRYIRQGTGTFIAFNPSGNTAYYSNDNMTTWTSFTTTIANAVNVYVRQLEYLNGNIVAIVRTTRLSTNLNGVASAASITDLLTNGFTAESLDTGFCDQYNAPAYHGGKYIVKTASTISRASTLRANETWQSYNVNSGTALYGDWYVAQESINYGNRILFFTQNSKQLTTSTTDVITSVEYILQAENGLYYDSPITENEDNIVIGGTSGKIYYINATNLASGASLTECSTPYTSGSIKTHKLL